MAKVLVQFVITLTCIPHLTFQHTLTPLDCAEGALLADLNLRKSEQVKYPGACALEYHSAIQIVMECLFGWDKKGAKERLASLARWRHFAKPLKSKEGARFMATSSFG